MTDQEYLNERVRETVLTLDDEELRSMLSQPRRYTRLALSVARKELARRRRRKKREEKAATQTSQTGQTGQTVPNESGDCWIEVWSETGFKGESFRIQGPANYPALQLGTEDWTDRIRSLRVGPQAFVLAYRDKDFTASMVAFGPNQEVANLSEFKFKDEIDSIRVIDSMKIFDRPPHQ